MIRIKMRSQPLGFLRHPANMQVILGTMNPARIKKAQVETYNRTRLTKQEWYDVYFAAGNDLP